MQSLYFARFLGTSCLAIIKESTVYGLVSATGVTSDVGQGSKVFSHHAMFLPEKTKLAFKVSHVCCLLLHLFRVCHIKILV